MLTRLIMTAVALGACATAATAQPAARGMAACRTDMATFCAGIEAGGGKRVACLIANKDKVSAPCSAALQQRAAQAPAGAATPAPNTTGPGGVGPSVAPSAVPPGTQAAAPAPGKAGRGRMSACRADLKTLCASVPAGGGGKMRCLQENQAKLSPTCAQTIGDLKSNKQVARAACASDAKTLCPGLKGDQRRACFTENQSKLSAECAAVIGKRAAR